MLVCPSLEERISMTGSSDNARKEAEVQRKNDDDLYTRFALDQISAVSLYGPKPVPKQDNLEAALNRLIRWLCKRIL